MESFALALRLFVGEELWIAGKGSKIWPFRATGTGGRICLFSCTNGSSSCDSLAVHLGVTSFGCEYDEP